jgi:hypothetical protein
MSKATVIIGDIEADAEKVLGWLAKGTSKISAITPTAAAALGTVLGTVGTTITATESAAASPANISLSSEVVADLKTVWPEVQMFLKTLGITI